MSKNVASCPKITVKRDGSIYLIEPSLFLASLERQGQLQIIIFEKDLIREDIHGRAVSHQGAFADHDAAGTDIHNQVKVVRCDDLGVGKGFEQVDKQTP